MNPVLVVAVTVLLSVTVLLALARMVLGPALLDRLVATELLLATMISAVGAEAAVHRRATTLPVLVVLALLGFLGSVALVRFAAGEES
ncbi:monovalent cation/H+ antiporter complex subunit F [Micromonospora cathayae]|uniref:Monovalent cation/H+ antiporter complex subunit F n=1 Tax=Micromonospora cathayae TaxID=3028804 RepID=A0ABY7ZWX1_9ACTN|nr:monovalent cation/H+ antiporter complex subunit F [Micromonospora sp. HUAS 3]WDZ87560.1 monovalent cation/H+ antiporter complex subunit F [Micromonospora sp. HUAS 3]